MITQQTSSTEPTIWTHPAKSEAETVSLAERLLQRLGRDKFNEGRSPEECLTRPEREGYMAALYEAADAGTSMYLASVNWERN